MKEKTRESGNYVRLVIQKKYDGSVRERVRLYLCIVPHDKRRDAHLNKARRPGRRMRGIAGERE